MDQMYIWSKDENECVRRLASEDCRPLLKKGNCEVLALFGYECTSSVEVQDFRVEEAAISIGEDVTFSFEMVAKEPSKIRLEYGIDYVKSGGKRNRKIFKISEIVL